MSDSSSLLPTLLLGAAIGLALGIGISHRRTRLLERERRIRAHVFPRSVLDKVLEAHPHLKLRDLFLVARALRAFFLVHLRAGAQRVEMPSRVVDVLWHAFILDTRAYDAFCRQAFGHFLHHIPASPGREDNAGTSTRPEPSAAMRLTWDLACREENIDPESATRLPLLFAIDAKLAIPGGLHHRIEDFNPVRDRNDGGGADAGGPASASSKGSGKDADGGSDGGGDGGGGCGGY
jgi:hypothetical protein